MGEQRQGIEEDAQAGAPNVAYMDQALWRALLSDNGLAKTQFYEAWLALQCRAVRGVENGVLFLAEGGGNVVIAAWQTSETTAPRLERAAESALQEGKPIMRIRRANAASAVDDCAVAVPVADPAAPSRTFVIAVTQKLLVGVEPRETIRELQWGAAWIRQHLLEQQSQSLQSREDRAAAALSIAASCLAHEQFNAAASALTVSLARALGCERVAFGIRKGQSTKLTSLSNNADFAHQMLLVQTIESAMDEAIDQQEILRATEPTDKPDLVLRQSQEALRKAGGAGHVMTAPVFVGASPIGALCLERRPGAPFTDHDAELVDTVASLVAPFLDKSLQNEKWVGRRLFDDGRDFLKTLFGPQHYARKAIAAVLLGFIVVGFLFKAPYAFDATAAIEGRIQRVVAAPIDGYIGAAEKRAGDLVAKGETLAMLDDRDLQLQLEGWQTVKRQRQREYDRALSESDRSALRILQAQIGQSEAQIGALTAQLERTRLIAPFDGLVVSGDLAQSIGKAVQRGEVLFELAPVDGFRVVLAIDEKDLDEVAVGQKGRLLLATYPDKPVGFEIVRVTPVAEVKDGKNVFIAEATLEDTSLPLRPGMEGVAKIETRPRQLFWIWTNELNDSIRLALWRFWG